MNRAFRADRAIWVAVVFLCSLGLSFRAEAEAYGIASENIHNLLIISAPFVPLDNFRSFTTLSSSRATLDGVPTLPGTDSGGGPVDAPITIATGSVFPGSAPAENAFSAIGTGGNYSYADAQVPQTALSQASLFDPVVFTGQLHALLGCGRGQYCRLGRGRCPRI